MTTNERRIGQTVKARKHEQRKDQRCPGCGEPPMAGVDGAEFGHFTADDGTFCQRCGRKQR